MFLVPLGTVMEHLETELEVSAWPEYVKDLIAANLKADYEAGWARARLDWANN